MLGVCCLSIGLAMFLASFGGNSSQLVKIEVLLQRLEGIKGK